MAASRTPGPLGLRGDRQLLGGLLSASLAGSHTPGSIGAGENAESLRGALLANARSQRVPQGWADSVLQRISGEFACDGETFRVVRPDDRRQIDTNLRYEIVSPDRAKEILRRKAAAPADGRTDPDALLAAATLIQDSRLAPIDDPLLLLRVLRAPASSKSESRPPSSPPPPRPRQRQLEPEPEPIESVNPGIVAALHDLDTSDDGFAPETEPSDDEVGLDASDESDESGELDESLE